MTSQALSEPRLPPTEHDQEPNGPLDRRLAWCPARVPATRPRIRTAPAICTRNRSAAEQSSRSCHLIQRRICASRAIGTISRRIAGGSNNEFGHRRPKPAVEGLRRLASIHRPAQSRQPITGAYHTRRPVPRGQPCPVVFGPLRGGLTVATGFVLISQADEKLIRGRHHHDEPVRTPIQDTITGSPDLDQNPVGRTTRQRRIQRRRLPLRLTPILGQRRAQRRISAADRHARTRRHLHLDQTPRMHREHHDGNIEVQVLPSTIVRNCHA